MPDLTGYYDARLRGLLADQQPVYGANGLLDEAAMRGGGSAPGTYAPAPINSAKPTYTNGHHFAGTNVPMSDQSYALLSNRGTQPIATDRDVLGGGKFGIRGWMNDHPVGVIAAMTALAAGGAALSPAAAGAGAGAGGSAATGAAAGGAASGATGAAAGGAAAGGAAAGAALPEIVVTGVAPGITAGEAAAIGAGAAGAGVAASSGGSPTDYGDKGGWQSNSDPVGTLGRGIGSGSNAGDLVLEGGAGTGVPGWLSTLTNNAGGLSGLLGGGGGGGGMQQINVAPPLRSNTEPLRQQMARRARAQALRMKSRRTPIENYELEILTRGGMGA